LYHAAAVRHNDVDCRLFEMTPTLDLLWLDGRDLARDNGSDRGEARAGLCTPDETTQVKIHNRFSDAFIADANRRA
jgi:hypothetical protein